MILSWPEHPCITASSHAKTEIKNICHSCCLYYNLCDVQHSKVLAVTKRVESWFFFSMEVMVPNKR